MRRKVKGRKAKRMQVQREANGLAGQIWDRNENSANRKGLDRVQHKPCLRLMHPCY